MKPGDRYRIKNWVGQGREVDEGTATLVRQVEMNYPFRWLVQFDGETELYERTIDPNNKVKEGRHDIHN